MYSHTTMRRFAGRKREFARSLTHVSRAALAASILSSGIANAETAVFFNDDIAAGKQTFVDTITAADANHNASNQGTTQTSHIYEFDILNTTGSDFLVIGSNGAPSVMVKTTRGGSAAPNSSNGNRGSDGFSSWSNSHDGTFADAESMGYTFNFFESDGTTAFSMNALGTLVNDWGTCCAVGNPTPDGGTADASEVYLRFDASNPILLGGISNTINSTEHFIGAINDENFFNRVTVIATGNGEAFGVGGYLTFSTVALNSVPAGSSVVEGDGLENPSTSIPDIDTDNAYYTESQLGNAQVNPNFVGGTLRFGIDTFVGADFTVQSQGGTIDSEGNMVSVTGTFTGDGRIQKTGAGTLILSGTNTNDGGFAVAEGILRAAADENLGGGPLTIGNAIFQTDDDMSSSRGMIVEHAGSRINVQNHDVTWNGEISGQGILNVLGNGRLELTGTNTHTGGTSVQGGTLVASSDDSLGEGALMIGNAVFQAGGDMSSERSVIVDHAASRVDIQGHDVTWLGAVTGQGTLNVLGNGRLILGGANTYTGGTTVAGGMLVGAAGAIQGNVANSGVVEFTQSTDGTYAGNMNGAGALLKTGEGVLELSGVNTHTGGTFIGEGTVRAANSESLGDGALVIGNAVFQAGDDMSAERALLVDHTASRFDVQGHQVTWMGDVTGEGRLNVLGNGRLTLTGENTYTGGTYVANGTLAGSVGAIQGDIVNDGMVEFDQSSDDTYAGTIAGSGGLRKLGLGMLELTGISDIAGDSYLDQGSLSINGLFGTNLLTVADGAMLYGSGGVDGSVLVLDGGMLKPGNSPGTLFVSGDVTLNPGSIFDTEIDGRTYSAAGGAGSYDRVVLTGEGATFTAAGSINPILRGITGAANNDFNPVIGDMFTVVLADNIAGTFDSVEQPADGLPANTRFKVIYGQDSIQLALVARSLGLMAQESGQRTNAWAAGYALDRATADGQLATGALASLFAEFDGMSQAQVGAALASLGGDFHAHILESTESILAGSDDMILSAALGGKGVGGIDRELKNGIRVWSRAEARGASYDADRAGIGFDEDVYGFTLGATLVNQERLRAGVAGSYKTAELYNDTAAGATNQMFSGYAYGSYTVTPRLTLSGLAGYTQATPKTVRTTVLSSVIAQTKSEEKVNVTHAQMEARYNLLNAGATRVYALGGLRTAILNVDAYSERGNVSYADLSLIGESRKTLQTKLGAEVAHTLAGTELAVFGNWARDIGDDPTVERTASLGDAFWQVQSVDRGLDTYNYGFSARREITGRVGVELEYTGRYNSPNYDAQQLMVGVNVAW